ncbi:hypothetical protein [Aquamicrobium zhengzhouense]|uniref:Uncharacterized protein n=1 Tax=Aquamicrobium zhengzhouense TaxID=2781738 RepID=A0ABS0SA76_9HYPH|nr:hypothetical protein [Aquamicrobium zhengzhouense]MBI1620131.1 hypothetical protein [Aquamicrobium zhengzhouense]
MFYPEFLGIPWYRESDYAEIRRVMIDGDSLPPTYFEWFRNAVQLEKSQQDNGVKVVRVMLNPAGFCDWCASRGTNPAAKARMEYARIEARRRLGK